MSPKMTKKTTWPIISLISLILFIWSSLFIVAWRLDAQSNLTAEQLLQARNKAQSKQTDAQKNLQNAVNKVDSKPPVKTRSNTAADINKTYQRVLIGP